MTYLGDDRLGGTADEAEESTNHTEESENETNEDSTNLRLGLEGLNRVRLGEVNEVEEVGADPFNRVFPEGNLVVVILLVLSGLVSGNLEGLLDLEGFSGELLGVVDGVADVDVVEEDVLSHGPELDTDTTDLRESLNGDLVLKEARVGDLTGRPLALVCGVVDERSSPLATPERVNLPGTFPFTASRSLLALGVRDSGSGPVTIFLVIPFLGLGSV